MEQKDELGILFDLNQVFKMKDWFSSWNAN